MSNNRRDRWVNIGLFITVLFQAISGLILKLVFPHGPGFHGRFTGRSFLGFDRGDWISMHNWVAIMLGLLVMLHIIHHWKWIKRNIFFL